LEKIVKNEGGIGAVKLTRLIISLFLSIALLALPLSEAAGVFAQVEPEFEIEGRSSPADGNK